MPGRKLYINKRKRSLLPSDKGFLYYPSPTKDSVLFLPHRISLLSQSDKGFFTIPLPMVFFTIPVRQRILYYSSLKGFFTIPVRQRILHQSSHKGFLYYSSLTRRICEIVISFDPRKQKERFP